MAWLTSLSERVFVGTESRLLTLFALLRQICEGTVSDPEVRLRELERRRVELEDEIARVRAGDVATLPSSAVKERFQQFIAVGRELLGDFREVEANFRKLDRSVREQIAQFDGAKADLLDEVLGEHDAIARSDEGRSFRAF